ncbi:hypothetical protein ACFO5R_04440 [Halosolutus amylolyticus]|uniref:Uncharacterized protein n=1 Tax=Halosolutus amylolyticus TaxID=2932267 RepID=A0ABD5PKQ5_9EURY|nr:hypothetical protein [Halosolutus amylolyticus]
MTRLTRLLELRRFLPLTAAGLFVLALTMPVWRIVLTAPQYMDPLVVELYAYPRLGGDFGEVHSLNKYVGFYYPDPVYVDPNYDVHEKAVAVPEWVLGPVVFVGLALASAVVACLPSGRPLRRGVTALVAGTIAIFGAMLAIIQYRLYQAGHSLDPDAPLSGVEGFTPPVLGTYEVANISGNAWFGPGGYVTLIAVGLLVVAFRFRDSGATVRDVPALFRSGSDRVRARIRGWCDRSGPDDRSGTDGGAGTRSDETPRAESRATDPTRSTPEGESP